MHRRVHAYVLRYTYTVLGVCADPAVQCTSNENGTSTPEQARLPRARVLAEAEPASAAV